MWVKTPFKDLTFEAFCIFTFSSIWLNKDSIGCLNRLIAVELNDYAESIIFSPRFLLYGVKINVPLALANDWSSKSA